MTTLSTPSKSRGMGFVKWIAAAAASLIVTTAAPVKQALAAGDEITMPAQSWSFDGVFGTFDRAQLQRGFQVYKEVCASCHSMNFLAYRNLGDAGGPEFSKAQVDAIAAEATVKDGPNEEGEMFERPGKPADHFVAPFENDNAARSANGGALPPDLSVITKARPHGPDYVYALLVGYGEAPEDVELREGMNYNKYFNGHQIAMPPPLSEDQVEFADGTKASVENMAHDVTAFLMWAAEPKLEDRHRIGFQVILFLIVLGGLLYFSKKKLWSDIDH